MVKKQLKFTLMVNIKENIYNMKYWYMIPSKLAKMFKNVSNRFGNIKNEKNLLPYVVDMLQSKKKIGFKYIHRRQL